MSTEDDLQPNKYSCGSSAIRPLLYVLNCKVTEPALRRLAGTDEYGTSAAGIIKAINHFDYKTRVFQTSSYKKAWKWLRMSLSKGRPVLICCYKWNHWVAAIGSLGGKILIFDPDSTCRKRRYFSGLEIHTKKEWRSVWVHFEKNSKKPLYYAISVSPTPS